MIGDPMELRALTAVFAESTDERGFCAVGSVKSNVGHLLMAAGMAGLQKIVLSLGHRQLPPTLHCERPQPPLRLRDLPVPCAGPARTLATPGGCAPGRAERLRFRRHQLSRRPARAHRHGAEHHPVRSVAPRTARLPAAPALGERTSRLDPSYPRPRPMFELEELI